MQATILDEVRSGNGPPLVAITVEQLQEMVSAGILHDGDPIELIDGLLVRKDRSARGESVMTHNFRHAMLVKRLTRLFTKACEPSGCHVQVQLPVTLNEINAPEPDIAVVLGTEDDYADRHPGPDDLLLVVEVADSSLRIDRTTKVRLYATAGVARYWLVNLADSQVEVFESPNQAIGTYTQQTVVKPGEILRATLSSDQQQVEITVADLLR